MPAAPRARRLRLPRAPRLRRDGARAAVLLAPALVVVVGLFGGALALAVAQSFGYLPFVDGWQWSTEAWTALPADVEVRRAVGLTLRLSLTATVLASALAVAAALLIRSTRRGRALLTAVFASSLPVPHVVGAAAMLLLLGQSGFASRVGAGLGLLEQPSDFPALTDDAVGWGILAEYVWKETPFIGVVVLAALARGVDELEEAARTLGASWSQRLRRVVLPHVLPSVAATSVVVFAFTFGSYEVPRLLGRPFPTTLPVVSFEAYSDADLASRPRAMAIAVLLGLVVCVTAVVYLKIVDRVARR